MSKGFIKLPEMKNWPTCAVCDKPVERLYQFEDPTDFGFKIAVKCHGKREGVSIPYSVLKDCDGDIRLGLAFAVEAANLLPPPTCFYLPDSIPLGEQKHPEVQSWSDWRGQDGEVK